MRVENAATAEESDVASRECTDLILKLWEKRMDWPCGGPLTYILPALRKLTSEPPTSYGWGWGQPEIDGSWTRLLPHLKELQAQESRICLLASFADINTEVNESARRWLNETSIDISDEERETMQLLLKWVDYVHSDECVLLEETIPNFGSLAPEERTKHIHEALDVIRQEKAEMLKQVKSHNEPLEILKPNSMHGNIDSNEERQAEYFNRLADNVYDAFEDSADGNEDDELDSEND